MEKLITYLGWIAQNNWLLPETVAMTASAIYVLVLLLYAPICYKISKRITSTRVKIALLYTSILVIQFAIWHAIIFWYSQQLAFELVMNACTLLLTVALATFTKILSYILYMFDWQYWTVMWGIYNQIMELSDGGTNFLPLLKYKGFSGMFIHFDPWIVWSHDVWLNTNPTIVFEYLNIVPDGWLATIRIYEHIISAFVDILHTTFVMITQIHACIIWLSMIFKTILLQLLSHAHLLSFYKIIAAVCWNIWNYTFVAPLIVLNWIFQFNILIGVVVLGTFFYFIRRALLNVYREDKKEFIKALLILFVFIQTLLI